MKQYNIKKFIKNKLFRRDYSKVSGSLKLPSLVEVQTKSYNWFKKNGLLDLFNEIFPIYSYNKNIVLFFENHFFEKPKYNAEECQVREANYAASLYANLYLKIYDKNKKSTIIKKKEKVYFGDLPIMTDIGTFVINGAKRVVVSQIVRSPGAYYRIKFNNKTGNSNISSELIPCRGTWIELISDSKKNLKNKNNGKIINIKIDKKRSILFTIFLKALGISFDIDKKKNNKFDISSFENFLKCLNLNFFVSYNKKKIQKFHLKNLKTKKNQYFLFYLILYEYLFGKYIEIENSLLLDKIDTFSEAIKSIYLNQRVEEISSVEAGINLINIKFFDIKRYNFSKAGRYKLHKKLKIHNRIKGSFLAKNIVDLNGKIIFKKDTYISKRQDLKKIEDIFNQGINTNIFPINNIFDNFNVEKKCVNIKKIKLEGRIIAKDIKIKKFIFKKGHILIKKDLKKLKGINIFIYTGIIAKKIKLNKKNVKYILKYGENLFVFGRLLDKNNKDIKKKNKELLIKKFVISKKNKKINKKDKEIIFNLLKKNKKLNIWLVGAAVQEMFVYKYLNNNKNDIYKKKIIKIVGTDSFLNSTTFSSSDLFAYVSYFLNILDNLGEEDDIDQLNNRRIRTSGELVQNQFRVGLNRIERIVKERMSISSDLKSLTPKNLINIRPLTSLIKEFFCTSQLSQFMDQTNPLAELANKRRITSLGPGGLSRDRAGFEVRDVHTSYYGRICPIETPEGPNIGLISNLTLYGKINKFGFIETPYRFVDKKSNVLNKTIYLTADEEREYVITQSNEISNEKLKNKEVVVRYQDENFLENKKNVELVDVSPKQIVSVATSTIPFLENDDASRALMGANMQKQAIPLLIPKAPLVGTGIEYKIGCDSGANIISKEDGIIKYVDSDIIIVKNIKNSNIKKYYLQKFERSNSATVINNIPIVDIGEKIKKGSVLADGPSTEFGELALGQNLIAAFMTWNGYNYEDAIIISDRLVKDDVFTSIHIEEYTVEIRETKLGFEEITRDIPNLSSLSCRHLDEKGIVVVGSEVKEGDILVGKVTPKGQSEVSPEEKLLYAVFEEKSREVRDNSLKVPHGGDGIVQKVKIFTRKKGYDLPPGVEKIIKVYIVQKRKISEGDKIAGRHGNKGVISKILPIEDMPFLEDGTPVDIILNPLGVPSRMNIGQVLELHLGFAAKKLKIKFATSVFDGVSTKELLDIMKEANINLDGKTKLFDGRTGKEYNEKISVGIMYFMKLSHMVDDKLHTRATGPYSLVTQQPLGGKSQNGGQRFGEMEVWSLYAYGAAYALQELMTIKSDDIVGRTKNYAAIQNGLSIPKAGLPESFRVLKHELQALALDICFLNKFKRKFKDFNKKPVLQHFRKKGVFE